MPHIIYGWAHNIKHSELDKKEQKKAASAMKVSRQTFGNILASARRKLADAVV